MIEQFKAFLKKDSGAVSVDWVVLTAGIVGLAVAAVLLAEDGMMSASNTIQDTMGDVTVE